MCTVHITNNQGSELTEIVNYLYELWYRTWQSNKQVRFKVNIYQI